MGPQFAMSSSPVNVRSIAPFADLALARDACDTAIVEGRVVKGELVGNISRQHFRGTVGWSINRVASIARPGPECKWAAPVVGGSSGVSPHEVSDAVELEKIEARNT